MLSTAIETLLILIDGLLPELGAGASTAIIDKILAALIQIVPIIASAATSFLPTVNNIIASLQNSTLTPAQVTALAALNAQVDAAFEAAATAAGDPAPPAAPATP